MGDQLSRQATQRIARVVKAFERQTAAAAGVGMKLVAQRPVLGVIVSEGPEGEPDFDDQRYWVQAAFVGNASGDPNEAAQVESYEREAEGRFAIRLVTNLAELDLGTHALPAGTVVTITHQPDRSDDPVRRWFMNVTPTEAFCIVREIPDPEAHWVRVQLLRLLLPPTPGQPWDGRVEAFGPVFPASCYPVMTGKDYDGLVVAGGNERQQITRAHPVLELDRRLGVWWVGHSVKRKRIHVTQEHRMAISDLDPIKTAQ